MNGLYFFLECIFPYISTSVFVVGTIYRLLRWFKIPVPLRINLAPAKTTWAGVVSRILGEVVVFLSLFRNDKTLWAIVWIMHVCGLIILVGTHFFGLIDAGVGLWTNYTIPAGKTILYVAALFSFPLVAALLVLLFKRVLTKEIRWISIPTDYFALGLVIGHVVDGIYLSFFTQLDMTEVMKWVSGLITFRPHIVQGSWIFAIHCLTGFGLFLYFPFSKLFHPLGQIANRWTMTQKEKPLISGGAVVK